MSRARARGGLGFGMGLLGGVLGEGTPVTMSSGTRLDADVWVTPPPSVGRGGERSSARGSESDDAFFSTGSRTTSSGTRTNGSYSLTTLTGTRTTTGLMTDETAIGFTSGGSNTQIAPSTLSYRHTDSASYLGDSHDSYTSTSSPGSALSRRREVRRSRATSRTYSSTDDSDKENNTPSGSRSATDAQWTLSTLQSYTRSGSSTPFPPSAYSLGHSTDE